MIKGIQTETEEAVTAMQQGNNEVSSGIALADQAGNSLKEVVASSIYYSYVPSNAINGQTESFIRIKLEGRRHQ